MRLGCRFPAGVALTWTLGCPAGTTLECAEPRPLLYSNGDATGFVKCADGALNRLEAAPVPAPADPTFCIGDENYLFCAAETDCTDGPNGRCVHFDVTPPDGAASASCVCTYFCTSDADCGDDEACVASELAGVDGNATCQPARCRGSEACESGECGLSLDLLGYWDVIRLKCRHPGDDICHGTDDCAEPQACVVTEARGADPYSCR